MMKRAILCAAAILMVAGVGMAAPKPAAATKKVSRTGWITDSKCGAKGAAAAHADCLKKCIDAGEKYVLYDPYDKKIYQLDPQSAVAEHGAHRVTVSGTLEGETIHVESVKMVAAPKKTAPAKKSS